MLLQGWFNLDSLSIIRLAALVLSLIITAYLLRVPRKSPATRFLAGVFLGALLFNTASFFEFAGPYYWQPRNLKTVLILLASDIGPSLAMVFLLLFAYSFPRFRHAERKEFRVVLSLSIGLNALVLGFNVYNHFVLQWQFSDTSLWDIYWLAFYCSLAVQFLAAIVLLFRKSARLSGHGPLLRKILRPRGRDAESARALALILLLPVLAVAASLAVTYGLLPFTVASYLTWLCLLLFFLGFVVTYLNHSADPLTLPVKLVGVTLVLVLATLGLVSLSVGETSAGSYPAPPLFPDRSTVRLTRNALGSYDIRPAPYAFDPDLGPTVEVIYGHPRVARLAFDFPFFSARYHTLHILNGPMLYLGEEVRENGWGGYNPQPAIAAIIMNLDPSRGGGVHFKGSADSATVTWDRLPELGASNENTVQIVLRADGSLDMSFGKLSPSCGPSVEQQYDYTAASTTGGDPAPGGRPAAFPPRLTGIHPGGWDAPLEPVSFTRGLPWSGTRPGVVFESHEAGFAAYLNARIAVLALLTVGASFLVVILIPFLLRTSLFLPVRELSQGMQRVERGELETEVKIRSQDEIGSLARSFNRMVESIRRGETNFRTLAEDAQDGIIVFSDEAAVYANRRVEEMTGCPVDGMSFSSLFARAEIPAYGVLPEAPSEAILVSGAKLPVELGYSWTSWRGRPALAVVVRDITRRKREEEAARQRQQELTRLDKLTSLGILAAGLAHEINVPNQVILSNASILSRGLPDIAGILRSAGAEDLLVAGMDAGEFINRWPGMLSAVAKSSALIDGIIHNLRDFSADSPSHGAAPVDLNEVIRSAVELAGGHIRRATDRFTLDLQPGLPRTRGSAQGLQQVFINLILNSCQSLGGRDKAITVRSSRGDSAAFLRVVVHDEGAGIPPEVLSRVREPFFTTRRTSGGTGLGLYVSQEIVTAHGGALELASRVGVGTDAIVTLPAEANP